MAEDIVALNAFIKKTMPTMEKQLNVETRRSRSRPTFSNLLAELTVGDIGSGLTDPPHADGTHAVKDELVQAQSYDSQHYASRAVSPRADLKS